MPVSGLIDALPFWGLFGATAVLVLLSIEAGYRIGRHRRQRSGEEKEAPVGAIAAATLALLGFLLAFTFGLAASRFDARRQIVVEEANAIGTTYLRAGLLPDARGARIRKLLGEYVDARLEAARTGDIEQVLSRSDALHRELWNDAEAVGKQHPDSIVVGLFIQSLNETIDLHAKRILVSVQNRIPDVLWLTLYLITILTMAGVGYFGGLTNSTRTLASIGLALTFAAVMSLVADLDGPREGLLRVSQRAMTDLQNMISDAR